MKAVDDTLVDPKVKQWDFKTLKHINGQGRIYIRSKKNYTLVLRMTMIAAAITKTVKLVSLSVILKAEEREY